MEDRKEPAHLCNLNERQYKAVVHPPHIPLQILAGPGSGKTRTLTSRIAHLILHHNTPPAHIVAVTFTNKAANEMRHRLRALLGNKVDALNLGTFHAICVLLLRKHGKAIGLKSNFSITDAEESKKIINEILRRFNARPELKDTLVLSLISKAKAKGWSPEDLALRASRNHERSLNGHSVPPSEKELAEIAPIYEEYMADLRKQNALDFDDLLGHGVKLLKKTPYVIKCEHIFVDEFQDTNSTQLELVCLFAQSHKRVTIVGDPDQSIYGWRAAEVENLHRMCIHFPDTVKICLEDNYRSTGAILETSIAIVSEDPQRPPKTLRTSHDRGVVPTLRECKNEHDEADFIAIEIKRLVAATGGMLKWSDFAILLRYNALSRALEAALQRESIPNRVLSGVKFFERIEIKDLLAYLQLVDNPDYEPSFLRVINVPKRQIGEKSINEIINTARKRRISSMALVEKIAAGRIPDTQPSVRPKVQSFVKAINSLRVCVNEGMSVANLLREIIMAVNYEEYLKESQKDWTARWENVQELITYATESQSLNTPSASQEVASSQPSSQSGQVRSSGPPSSSKTAPTTKPEEPEVINLVSDDEGEDEERMKELERLLRSSQERKAAQLETPLRLFLQTSMLSTDTEVKADGTDNENKVTISTCHAAKGLEWPVVIVPSVEDGTFPFYRTEDVGEERRLLYVGCTRAQGLLYLTHAKQRMLAGHKQERKLSSFITIPMQKKKHLFTHHSPALTETDLVSLSLVLGRPVPDMEKITAMTSKFIELYKEPLREKTAGLFGKRPSSGHKPGSYSGAPTPLVVVPVSGFASARSAHHMQIANAPHAAKLKGTMNNLVHPTAEEIAPKALITVSATPTVPKLPSMIFQSGSAALRPFVPSREKPPKVPDSPTPDDASSTTGPTTTSALTSTHLLPVASPTATSHLQHAYMGPDMAPPPILHSRPSRGAIVLTPLSTLPHHSGSSFPQARNTTDQIVQKTMSTNIPPPTSLAGAKRRLGMGHSGTGYASKRKKATNCNET